MTFGVAIRAGLMKYAEFTGRASRVECGWWFLFVLMGWVATLFMGKVVYLWEIAMVIPSASVMVRRIHDSNHSGWWALLPFTNILMCFAPPVEPNRFTDSRDVA